MRHRAWQWLAISSLLVWGAAAAETRPQYGGTLQVTLRAAPMSLDPAAGAAADSAARRNLTMLMYDTLVTSDDNGQLQPGLALSWEPSAGNQHWRIRLRRGIRFHDGTPLTAEIAASSLRAANPSWNVRTDGESVIIECAAPESDLPAELALAHNAIAKKNAEGKFSGTGPFHVVEWQPGKKLSLAAEDDYWRGRVYLDAIEIEFGKSLHDQQSGLEIGKADLIEVAPEQSHRTATDGRHVTESAPIELLALLFNREAQTSEEKLLREALRLSVERSSMRSVLLQGAGQPAASILPTWMSGYGFVFPADADLGRARQERQQVRNIPTWTVGYEAGDAIARLLVERIALNAKDAGLTLQPTTATTSDLRLVRLSLASADPWLALAGVADVTGLARPKSLGGSVEDLYAAEKAMLANQRLVPLFHLPVVYAAAASVRNNIVHRDGTWNLADVWRVSEKP
jgi:ABC-type transport system substrate-binding protein